MKALGDSILTTLRDYFLLAAADLALDLDQWPEIWPDEVAPVLVVTIGGKETEA